MIFAQEVEHLLGLGRLGESGVAAQIAEHDYDLAAMTFEDFFIALRDDEFGELWREEPFQPPHPPQFLNLCRDARLQFAVPPRNLLGALGAIRPKAERSPSR